MSPPSLSQCYFEREEARDGVRFPWNQLPPTNQEAKDLLVPLSVCYTPLKALVPGASTENKDVDGNATKLLVHKQQRHLKEAAHAIELCQTSAGPKARIGDRATGSTGCTKQLGCMNGIEYEVISHGQQQLPSHVAEFAKKREAARMTAAVYYRPLSVVGWVKPAAN